MKENITATQRGENAMNIKMYENEIELLLRKAALIEELGADDELSRIVAEYGSEDELSADELDFAAAAYSAPGYDFDRFKRKFMTSEGK